MMVFVLVLWYIVKHFLASRRQTPYQRGIYEQFFYQLANAYPQLWTRSGPDDNVRPDGLLDRLKWDLVTLWNDPAKTIGKGDQDEAYDDLGAVARLKRTHTRQWTSQIRVSERGSEESITKLEAGDSSGSTMVQESKPQPQPTALFMRTSATGDLPGGMVEVPDAVPASAFIRKQNVVSRPSSAEDGRTSSNRNSGIMVEEEPSTWLRDYGVKINDVSLY